MTEISAFKKKIWNHYKKEGRQLPWRETHDAYKIFVSEVMLQQTQVDRVIPKYKLFLKTFPNWNSLAQAPFPKVLSVWQGLGYNRRALHLKRSAQIVAQKYKGKLPSSYEELIELPGIGSYTAHALRAFVWNKPDVFIETNIRSVFIHEFFPRAKKVPDTKLVPLIEKTVDIKNARLWYYALMDYGAHLKKTVGNASERSAHHIRQSTFKGSLRELRGHILRTISEKPQTEKMLGSMQQQGIQLKKALSGLQKDGLIEKRGHYFHIVG